MLDTLRSRSRHAHAGAQAWRGAAADGGDRQGALAERARPRDGRADRRPLRSRDRACSSDRSATFRARRRGASSTSRTVCARSSTSATGSRCCATDGSVADVRPSDTTTADLVRTMVGREVSTTYRQAFCEQPGRSILETRQLTAANGISGADIEVRAGEIVGLAGLVGAGRTRAGARDLRGGRHRLRRGSAARSGSFGQDR